MEEQSLSSVIKITSMTVVLRYLSVFLMVTLLRSKEEL